MTRIDIEKKNMSEVIFTPMETSDFKEKMKIKIHDILVDEELLSKGKCSISINNVFDDISSDKRRLSFAAINFSINKKGSANPIATGDVDAMFGEGPSFKSITVEMDVPGGKSRMKKMCNPKSR
jgi:hypothetical protein